MSEEYGADVVPSGARDLDRRSELRRSVPRAPVGFLVAPLPGTTYGREALLGMTR
jgi:hypothetical protein